MSVANIKVRTQRKKNKVILWLATMAKKFNLISTNSSDAMSTVERILKNAALYLESIGTKIPFEQQQHF